MYLRSVDSPQYAICHNVRLVNSSQYAIYHNVRSVDSPQYAICHNVRFGRFVTICVWTRHNAFGYNIHIWLFRHNMRLLSRHYMCLIDWPHYAFGQFVRICISFICHNMRFVD